MEVDPETVEMEHIEDTENKQVKRHVRNKGNSYYLFNFEFIEPPTHWWAHFPTGYCPIDRGDFRMISTISLSTSDVTAREFKFIVCFFRALWSEMMKNI